MPPPAHLLAPAVLHVGNKGLDMPIEVGCECGKRFRAPDSAAGKRGRCSGCGRTLTIPSPAAELEASPFDDGFIDVAPPQPQRTATAARAALHTDHYAATTGAAGYAPVAAHPMAAHAATAQPQFAADAPVGLAGSPLLPRPVQRDGAATFICCSWSRCCRLR